MTAAHKLSPAKDHAHCAQDEGGRDEHGAHDAHRAHRAHASKGAHGGHGAHHGSGASLVTAAQATWHCLSGCVIGEILGLAIGVSLGLGAWTTMTLATALSYVSGFTLGLTPVMRREGRTFLEALKLIWFGEAVSIAVMEIAMNATDYMVGGVGAPSLSSPTFWLGLAAAIPVGFIAAFPVNYVLLKRGAKKCH